MHINPFIRFLTAGMALWADAWMLVARTMATPPRTVHAAIDPSDPAADRGVGPAPVRSAGPEAMRDGDHLDWDRVDQAVDESFPASDPPAR